jgi:hypothetical protein
MNLSTEEKKIAIARADTNVRQVKNKKGTSRRYSIRLFAAAGIINKIRKPFLLFSAMALLTFTLCMMAPETRDKKGQQSVQSKVKNDADSVSDFHFQRFLY